MAGGAAWASANYALELEFELAQVAWTDAVGYHAESSPVLLGSAPGANRHCHRELDLERISHCPMGSFHRSLKRGSTQIFPGRAFTGSRARL